MKIVSTTLAGPGSEATIGKAIASVAPLVDEVIVLANAPTHEECDEILLAAARIDAPPFEMIGTHFTWENDFAAARNRALALATERGADWCLWIDTDEWFEYDQAHPEHLRQVLSETPHGALMVYHASRTYCQPRLIKLPTPERWVGRTHECFAAYKVGQGTLAGLVFNDSPKSPEAFRKKCERDRDILQADLETDPKNSRSWFYLGESLRNLGDFFHASYAYERCAHLNGWNEESGWACYRHATCLIELGAVSAAVFVCARGLALHAGIPELAWLAGWCSARLGRHEQAIHWALMAAAGGAYEGHRRGLPERIGFRHLPALYEGPFDVMRHSYKTLGLVHSARIAEVKFEAARTMRLHGGMIIDDPYHPEREPRQEPGPELGGAPGGEQ